MEKTVKSYIAAIPKARRPLFDRLQGLILGLYPKAEVIIWYGLPTYRARGGFVCLANQKSYVSLYSNSPAHIADFKKSYPKMKTGKACINFRDSDEVPVAAVKEVIRHAMEHSVKAK